MTEHQIPPGPAPLDIGDAFLTAVAVIENVGPDPTAVHGLIAGMSAEPAVLLIHALGVCGQALAARLGEARGQTMQEALRLLRLDVQDIAINNEEKND